MEEFHTIDKFGPTDAFKFIASRFSNADVIKKFNPEKLKDKRNQLDYGEHVAKKQWALTLRKGTELPEPDDEECFVCGSRFKIGGKREWNSPEVEHLLPSAFAFLLFGLPGDFHEKWLDKTDENSLVVSNYANLFGILMKPLQNRNYRWCHSYCNQQKSDSIFIDILEQTDSCKYIDEGKCYYRIKSENDIKINMRSIRSYIIRLQESPSDRAISWRRQFERTDFDLLRDFPSAFGFLTYILTTYEKRNIISSMIRFNLNIGLCIVSKYLKKEIPKKRVDKISKLCDHIMDKNKSREDSNMEGGGNEYLDEKFTEEEFEDLLKLGEAIKYYADLPYPGKEEDDAFIKEYMADYHGELEAPQVPAVPLRINVPQRMNVMNNTPRLATPRVATPTRTKRSRNNNANENQDNMRNENYISKTLALKKPRVTRNFRPNRRPFAPLSQMQMAGKYKKTRKNRK